MFNAATAEDDGYGCAASIAHAVFLEEGQDNAILCWQSVKLSTIPELQAMRAKLNMILPRFSGQEDGAK